MHHGKSEVMKTNNKHNRTRDTLHRFDCDRDHFLKGTTFSFSLANNRIGSSKSYGLHNVVWVRGLRESFVHFVNSGFPLVYELRLEKAIVM